MLILQWFRQLFRQWFLKCLEIWGFKGFRIFWRSQSCYQRQRIVYLKVNCSQKNKTHWKKLQGRKSIVARRNWNNQDVWRCRTCLFCKILWLLWANCLKKINRWLWWLWKRLWWLWWLWWGLWQGILWLQSSGNELLIRWCKSIFICSHRTFDSRFFKERGQIVLRFQ